jgi:hypothetical protein
MWESGVPTDGAAKLDMKVLAVSTLHCAAFDVGVSLLVLLATCTSESER